MAKQLVISGTLGTMLIGESGSLNIYAPYSSGGALTDPYSYNSALSFHSDLPYIQIRQRIYVSSVTFAAVPRAIYSWDDGGKKGCFITTACTEHMQLPDNCEILEKLRKYRDNYLCRTKQGIDVVEQYYKTAPAIVELLDLHKDKSEIYTELYTKYIVPAVEAIDRGDNYKAYFIYKSMYDLAKTKSEEVYGISSNSSTASRESPSRDH